MNTIQYPHLSSYPQQRGRLLSKTLLVGALLLGCSLAPVHAADNAITVNDPKDMADSSGDIRSITAHVKGGSLYLSMTVEGVVAPSVEQTPVGMNNRYYYHWLLDTDNNPATGRSNAEYEGTPTGLVKPIGADRVIMLGWRDGKPNGVEIYDPANEDVAIATNFTHQVSGNTVTAIIPLSDLGLTSGQTIAVSAFQEGSSDNWSVDWIESQVLTLGGSTVAKASVADPKDMADSSGDIRRISMHVEGQEAILTMTVEGVAAPSVEQTPVGMNNRYYYHWLIDTDNNPATGRSNAEYEGNPTGLTKPIGAERVIMVGWRDGKPNGVELYDPANEDVAIATNFTFQASGNTLTARVPLSELGVTLGQTVAVSAFQEGSSDNWSVDWIESQALTLAGPSGPVATVLDPNDIGDSSGNIRKVIGYVEGANLMLLMTVEGVAAPSTENTPVGMNNRYYYHWLLDTDNNPATGRSNAEYEGSPTGLTKPIGAERVIMVGWRDGKPNGVEIYDPANEDVAIATNFTYQASGNTVSAVIPLATLGLTPGQTIALSAFQEGSSEGWKVDWVESQTLALNSLASEKMQIDGVFQDWADANLAGAVTSIPDPSDMADPSGDIRSIQATVEAGNLYLRLVTEGIALPSTNQTTEGMINRYYYHWLLDTDNNPATGRSNAEYEGTPTGVTKPIGAERVIMLGWRDGKPNGLEVYDPANEDVPLLTNFVYSASSNSVEIRVKMSDIGLSAGQTIALSAFQEGASANWSVDWAESKVMSLTEAGSSGFELENEFSGNPYGFKITLTDASPLIVNTSTVLVRLDGEVVPATIAKSGGTTTITGKHAALLPAGTSHRIGLSLMAGSTPQAKDFVFIIDPYSVLPAGVRLSSAVTKSPGFVVNMTKISELQAPGGNAHSNRADLAEMQLSGSLINPDVGTPYINEADGDWSQWIVVPSVETGPINWYELAPGSSTLLNFTNDAPFPKLDNSLPNQGVAAELLTYLDLQEGHHKIGVYSEGGHKVNAGLSAASPVLSIFDNSGSVPVVPTYFARSQFFDVIAPEAGLYPLRLLWFQARRNQEPGLMLELFTVKDRQLHLINETTNPQSVRAYRAASLLELRAVLAPILITRSGNNLSIQYSGTLQWADSPSGAWADYPDQTQKPAIVPITNNPKYFRSRSQIQ